MEIGHISEQDFSSVQLWAGLKRLASKYFCCMEITMLNQFSPKSFRFLLTYIPFRRIRRKPSSIKRLVQCSTDAAIKPKIREIISRLNIRKRQQEHSILVCCIRH